MPFTVEHGTIEVKRTTRYCTMGRICPDLKEVWIVCHGFGQLSEYFIKNFESLACTERFFIAPEAMSRFYLNQQWERVGACWMTKEMRDEEIVDNVNYLSAVYEHFIRLIDFEKVTVNLLGFSQGGSVCWRFVNETYYKIDNLILWAGSAPAEFRHINDRKNMRIYAVYGEQDQYISPRRVEEIREVMAQTHLPVEVLTFQGNHIIETETLKNLANIIKEKSL